MENRDDRRATALGSFHVLSDELLCEILELLAAKDLAILACVSSVLYIFCNEDPLWKKLCLKTQGGLLKYSSSWKKTVLESLNVIKQNGHAVIDSKLYFEGFSSLFLYRRWYRCNVNLSSFYYVGRTIERKHGLSLKDFSSNYDGKKPLLLDGLADGWQALENWGIDYLVKHYGKCIFKVAQSSDKKVLMCFEDYASYMRLQHDEDPLYIFDPKFGEVAPGLIQDYQVPNLFKEDLFDLMDHLDRPPFRWLVIGPPRSGASWHVDPALTSAWNTLLRGRKRWALYPPGRVPPSVIVHGEEEDGDVEIDAPSSLQWWMDVYPALKDEDKPLECIQVPGETIFVPSGWWHCVLNLEDSVAVTQNFVDTTNFDLVCLDLTPGHHHKAVARAGRLALQDCASVAAKEAEKIKGLGCGKLDWDFSVDSLALYVDRHASFSSSQSLRKWLQNLWLSRSDLRQRIWKGACVAFDAETLLEKVISICVAHNLPLPTEAEQLPLGHGSNPVFLIGSNVVKICIDDAGENKAIDGIASEMQFYSQVKNCGSPLKDCVPKLIGSGVLYSKDRFHWAVAWDGNDEPQDKGNKGRRGESLGSGDFHRARWNQAVLNPTYLDSSDDDEPEGMEGTAMICPYIITDRCKGVNFARMRGRMQERHVLAMADLLGKHVHNLHSLPVPPIALSANGAQKQEESQQPCKTNGKACNYQRTDPSCSVPNEWVLFISMMRRQREQVIDQLDRWKSVPPHLMAQLEDYLPVDLAVLAGVSKASAGVLQMGRPVWLHMDVTDENIQVVLDTPPESEGQAIESGNEISACYLLDFGDVCLGDPLYELVAIFLDVFLGNAKFFKSFLASYGRPLTSSQKKGGNHEEMAHDLSYRAMCYTILHEENALGAAFNIWKELKTASTWKEVEQRVWGCLSDYKS